MTAESREWMSHDERTFLDERDAGCSSADSIIDGGLLGGGYGPTRILPTTPPSHSLTPAMAAATTANPMDSFGEAAPMRANAVAAAASATMLATLSTFRSMVMFLSATEHDLH